MHPCPKVKKIRDRAYLEFVRSLPCIICGKVGVEAHHQAEKGHGTTGGKPGDERVLPVCVYHHSFGGTKQYPGSIHGPGKLTGWSFWEFHGVDIERYMKRIQAAFELVQGRRVGEKRGNHSGN